MTDDHRVRVAKQRRDKMRKRLLGALMSTYANRQRQAPPSVDDVVAEADVARATFYKYFNSVEEAMSALGRELIEEMVESQIQLFDGPEDSFFRMTTSIHMFLLRSVIDPVWASFVSSTDYLARDAQPFTGIAGHLADARAAGLVEFDELDAAVSLALGGMMEGIREIGRLRDSNRAYVEELVVLILRGLGVDRAQARQVVRDRSIYIRGLAPDRLAWWRDPWA